MQSQKGVGFRDGGKRGGMAPREGAPGAKTRLIPVLVRKFSAGRTPPPHRTVDKKQKEKRIERYHRSPLRELSLSLEEPFKNL